MDDSPDKAILAAVAGRLHGDPGFLAAWLAAAPDGGEGLVRRLGLDDRGRASLALCRPPRPDRFAADVTAVARYLGVDADELAAGLREAAALTGLATDGHAAVGVDEQTDGGPVAVHGGARLGGHARRAGGARRPRPARSAPRPGARACAAVQLRPALRRARARRGRAAWRSLPCLPVRGRDVLQAGNRYLDRTLLVETFGPGGLAFFDHGR